MRARDLVARLATTSVTPVLRPGGFRKRALTYARRVGEAVQVVNLHLSAANLGERGGFYVNVGVDLDALHRLEGREVPSGPPKEHGCQLRWRLEQFLDAGVPARWEFGSEAEGTRLEAPLRAAVEDLPALLDRLDSVGHVLEHARLDRGTFLGRRAQLQFVAGDEEGAAGSMALELEAFQDRPGWDRDWDRRLAQLGLTALRVQLGR